MPPRPRRFLPTDLSRSQVIWLTVGLADLVVISVIAYANFQSIYNSQKDFLVGALFSVAGFCFGRAFSRTREQLAISMIIGAPTPAVDQVLRKKTEERLHDEGAFRTLSVLNRDIEAAVARLSEYYDSQARRLEFYRHAPLLRVALDDLDKAAAGVAALRAILDGSEQRPDEIVPVSIRLDLVRIRRDLREAIGRRDQAYEWLTDRLGSESAAAWDLFAVMTADMLKADRMLEALWSQHLTYPVPEYLRTVHGYLTAALHRAAEFETTLTQQEIALPTIYHVMVADLTNAGTILGDLAPKAQEVKSTT